MNFREQGHAIIDLLADYYENIESNTDPIPVQNSPTDMLNFWKADFEKKYENSLLDHFQDILKRSNQVQHPNFIGHQVASPLPFQALVNALISTINGSIAIYEMGATGLAMEKIVADYFIEKFDFGSQANGLFVSGGSIGNLTALLAARQAKAGYDVIKHGSNNDLAVMVSEEAHYCVSRAVQIMGMGESGVIKIKTDDRLKIIPEQLEVLYNEALANGKKVIAVVGNACSTSTGTYDDLEVMADFCEKYDLWFHLDGAHGAPVVLSDKYKKLLKGGERADSIVMDFHKMLLTPALTTLILFKNGQSSHEAFAQKADYLLTQTHDWHQGANRTIECTRTMKSLRVYALLKYYGGDYLGEYVTRMYDLGQFLANEINQRTNFELATIPDSNIVCFRFKNSTGENTDLFNKKLRKAILDDGSFYLVQTVVRGKVYLRCTIINRKTKEKHLLAMLNKIEELVKFYS